MIFLKQTIAFYQVSGNSLNLKIKANSSQKYFILISYLWGGKIENKTFVCQYFEKNLNISVNQPKIVYPGKKSKIEVNISDAEGKPVEGVDLTAFSMTKKFWIFSSKCALFRENSKK